MWCACVHVFVCWRASVLMCVPQHVWRSEGNFCVLILSFHCGFPELNSGHHACQMFSHGGPSCLLTSWASLVPDSLPSPGHRNDGFYFPRLLTETQIFSGFSCPMITHKKSISEGRLPTFFREKCCTERLRDWTGLIGPSPPPPPSPGQYQVTLGSMLTFLYGTHAQLHGRHLH